MSVRSSIRLRISMVFTAVLLLFAPLRLSGQQLAKRLILKDGTYQMATKWEVHGDRVRYYSAERDAWEEVPNSMVDWAATDQYEKDRGKLSPEAIQLNKELEAERKAEEANAPEVAPGLRLKDAHAAYLLDEFQNHPELVLLQQHGGKVEQDVKKTIFRGIVPGNNEDIALTDAHAGVQSHQAGPTLYVNSGGGPPDTGGSSTSLPWDRFRIVAAEQKEDKRIVSRIKVTSSGKPAQQQNIIKTTSEQLTGGWIKITPVDPLQPGEYALVELLGDEGINLYVWDFGVNPQAPANLNAEQPEPAPSSQQPVLQQRSN